LITAIALSGVLGSNVVADDTVSSQAIYDSKSKTLSLEGILVPFIDEFTGKETDNKGIFDAQLQEKTKLVFELIPWSITNKNMFNGDDTSGYILYDHKTRSVNIPCFEVVTTAIFGDAIEGETIYYKDVNMKQRHLAYPIFHVEDMTETNNCENSVIPQPEEPPKKPTLTTTPTTTIDDIVEVEVNGEDGTTVFVNGVDSGETIDSTGKLKITLDTSGDDGDKSFSITLKDDKGNESEALTFTIKKIRMRSCKSILDAGLSNGDGIYTIDPDGKEANPSFDVYCHNMQQDTPKEYLELKKIGDNYNYSLYKSGGSRTGEDVVTHYTKIKINPETLIVDTTDTTFSSTTGKLYYNNRVSETYAQYGKAWDCITSNSAKGKANIDLTETPFKIHDNLIFSPNHPTGSYHGNGTSSFEENRQIVNTTGGGYCGANYPKYNDEWILKLDFL
jgi:hypothetical protein